MTHAKHTDAAANAMIGGALASGEPVDAAVLEVHRLASIEAANTAWIAISDPAMLPSARHATAADICETQINGSLKASAIFKDAIVCPNHDAIVAQVVRDAFWGRLQELVGNALLWGTIP